MAYQDFLVEELKFLDSQVTVLNIFFFNVNKRYYFKNNYIYNLFFFVSQAVNRFIWILCLHGVEYKNVR